MTESSDKYQHYKGGTYRMLAPDAILESTGEIMCVYVCARTGGTYVRPHAEFFGNVIVNVEYVQRFKRCVDAN